MEFSQQRPRSSSAQSRQPAHRRPSWAKHQKSYDIYMRTDLAADRSPGASSGLENYSYDDAHLKQWPVPEDLMAQLPSDVKRAVSEWKYAGAAVCTALERISKLDDESFHRGYPEKTLAHLSRHPSAQSSAVLGAQTPPMGSPVSPAPIQLPANLLRLETLDHFAKRQVIGMESPPFTPVDTDACPTPDMQGETAQSSAPDMLALTRQLSPLSMASVHTGSVAGSSTTKSDLVSSSFGSTFSTASSTPSLVTFDETAWETFLKTYDAELFDVRTNAGPRLKGAGYTIDKARVEWSLDKQHDEVVLAKFNDWWLSMKLKVAKYDTQIRDLEAPNIETIRAERAAYGLPV